MEHPVNELISDVGELHAALGDMRQELAKVIVGQKDTVEKVIAAMLAGGHCLLMGVPGLAKTLLVSTLARVLELDFNRIQFTPDLMPSDITGTEVLDTDADGKRSLRFVKGPVFTNLLLADEINRTPPKTQAAMLEAMQERRVTNSGKNYPLPEPFFVLATQNPLEQEGTYPLPEAQLDRFMFLVKMDYPTRAEEILILQQTTTGSAPELKNMLDAQSVLYAQELVRAVPVSDHVAAYCADLARMTRPQSPDAQQFIKENLSYGAGPRAGQYLMLAAKAAAVMEGRINVSCEDVRRHAPEVLRHRIGCNFHAVGENLTADDIVKQLLEQVPEPKA